MNNEYFSSIDDLLKAFSIEKLSDDFYKAFEPQFKALQNAIMGEASEQEKEDFFKPFFADGGTYMKYISVSNDGSIDPDDMLNVGKEYKIGVVVTVRKEMLKKDLEYCSNFVPSRRKIRRLFKIRDNGARILAPLL